MKIRATITAAADCGDYLKIEAQGNEVSGADWRPMQRYELRVDPHESRNRAFHVGRELMITIEPIRVR